MEGNGFSLTHQDEWFINIPKYSPFKILPSSRIPLPSPCPLPPCHPIPLKNSGKGYNSCLFQLIRLFSKANEIAYSWLWVGLSRDCWWGGEGSTTTTSPADSPKFIHTRDSCILWSSFPPLKLGKRVSSDKGTPKSLGWTPGPRATSEDQSQPPLRIHAGPGQEGQQPAFLFFLSENQQEDVEAEGDTLSSRTFYTFLVKVGESQENPISWITPILDMQIGKEMFPSSPYRAAAPTISTWWEEIMFCDGLEALRPWPRTWGILVAQRDACETQGEFSRARGILRFCFL